MSNKRSLARPYAKAVFELAVEQEALAEWFDKLNTLALLVQDPTVMALIKNPRLAREKLADLLSGIVGQWVDQSAIRLLHLLTHYRRLELLPSIAELYTQYRSEYEKKRIAKVKTPVPLTEQQRAQLQKILKKKWHCDSVELDCEVDPKMLGGIWIQCGDQVIDNTLHMRLKQLEQQLTSLIDK